MADRKIDSVVSSDLTNAMTDFSVDSAQTDGPTDAKKNEYLNDDWEQQLGYYKNIPELSSVIDAKATWTVGKGFTADEETTMLLDSIKGINKDTFNTILENMIRTMHISGDAFCEIIRDDEDNLINLKVLGPETMRITANGKGIITDYDQVSKVGSKIKVENNFKPNEIFHLMRNRVADEFHGQSMIFDKNNTKLTTIILMKNEAMADNRIAMHRNVVPRWKFKLKTDDPTEIAAYKAKMDSATGLGENIYEPFDVSEGELISVPPNSTLNPLAWIESLDAKFYEAAQVPKIIVGGTGAITEAAVKIAYLAFQQTIEEEQLFIEEQVLSQLNLVINLEFPASLENELLSDKAKDGPQNIDASETTAGAGQ